MGRSILPFSSSQQGGSIIDQGLPALLPEVNNVLGSVLLQVEEPAQIERAFRNVTEECVCVCVSQHSHCLLVRFEQLAGELAEDGQVGEIRRRSHLWSLTELLEHKLYAIPE